MSTENRDIIIGASLALLLLILWLAANRAPATAPIETAEPEQTIQMPGGISYNMPPLLTLPPYNAGNSTSTIPTTEKSNCGCNACGGKQTPTSYGNMSDFWNGISSGIVAPTMTTSTDLLPEVKDITVAKSNTPLIYPGSNTFADWKYVEGIGSIIGVSGKYSAKKAGSVLAATNQYNIDVEEIPGVDFVRNWSDKQKYDLYKFMHGQQFKYMTDIEQQKVIDYIFESST